MEEIIKQMGTEQEKWGKVFGLFRMDVEKYRKSEGKAVKMKERSWRRRGMLQKALQNRKIFVAAMH